MPLIKLNNVLRLTALTGLFVTTIFYLTKKVMAVYGLAVLINIVTIIILLIAEGKIGEEQDGKSDQELKDAKIDEDSIGGSPVVLLVFNMILPLVFGPSFYWLYGQTGLILHDNDKIAENEVDFLHGQNSVPSSQQIEMAQKGSKPDESNVQDNSTRVLNQ